MGRHRKGVLSGGAHQGRKRRTVYDNKSETLRMMREQQRHSNAKALLDAMTSDAGQQLQRGA